ncbi:hypothetical protein BDZ97DRAFT_1921404 [Flammula alnicola]|nr:hypothetical protein BDZ97DRAFT_1921404 [Flammula alnicola]
MPYSRTRITPCYGARYFPVRAVLYGAASTRPSLLPIQTRITSHQRSPLVEEALSGSIQPRIHDTIVTIRRGRRQHRFQIFVKNHKYLPTNAAVLALMGRQWHGDILVMRMGYTTNGVVNIRSGDQRLIEYALQRFLQVVWHGVSAVVNAILMG